MTRLADLVPSRDWLPRDTPDVVQGYHGTLNGYNNHGCRCTACREANRLSQQQKRAEHACESPGCPYPVNSSFDGRYYCYRHLQEAKR